MPGLAVLLLAGGTIALSPYSEDEAPHFGRRLVELGLGRADGDGSTVDPYGRSVQFFLGVDLAPLRESSREGRFGLLIQSLSVNLRGRADRDRGRAWIIALAGHGGFGSTPESDVGAFLHVGPRLGLAVCGDFEDLPVHIVGGIGARAGLRLFGQLEIGFLADAYWLPFRAAMGGRDVNAITFVGVYLGGWEGASAPARSGGERGGAPTEDR
jgi:hypothetical protein